MTDASWKSLPESPGPDPGWEQPGFDDSGWNNAAVSGPEPNLTRFNPPPSRIWDALHTPAISKTYLRKTFTLSGAEQIFLDYSVDDDARMYINGTLVVSDDNDCGAATYTNFDITSYLNLNGSNTIALEVSDCQGDWYFSAQLFNGYHPDNDLDGFGSNEAVDICPPMPAGYVTNNSDCDDFNSNLGLPGIWYYDTDDDGYGDLNNSTLSCFGGGGGEGGGLVTDTTDCDDTDFYVHPGASENCNGVDDNCNGTIDDIGESFVGIQNNSNGATIYYFDPLTFEDLSSLTLTLPGFTVKGGLAIDKNPVNGIIYAILNVFISGNTYRKLVTVDMESGVCALVGNLDDYLFSSFTFTPSGKLYGVTGESGVNPTTLFEINTDDGTTTLLTQLGNGADGEVIAFNKDDGFIYHWSDGVFEKINTVTLEITDIPESGYNYFEIMGAVYRGNGIFLIADYQRNFIEETTTGSATQLINHGINKLRGFVQVPIPGTQWFADADGDSYGNANEDSLSCTQPVGYVADNADCDDSDPSINPGLPEVFGNLIDENCNGTLDEATGDFRTVQSGDWNDVSNWMTYDGVAWVTPIEPPNSDANAIIIKNGHTITVTNTIFVDQLVIEAGASLDVSGVDMFVEDGSLVDMQCYGSLHLENAGLNVDGEARFEDGALLFCNTNSALNGPGTFNINSGCDFTIQGVGNSVNFGNGVIINNRTICNWNGGDISFNGNTCYFNNMDRFNINDVASILVASGTHQFVNIYSSEGGGGRVVLNVEGQVTIECGFRNDGTVNVISGVLSVTDNVN
ncbi:MAG: MopE-related protein, partial [Chitinophagales bacterium]